MAAYIPLLATTNSFSSLTDSPAVLLNQCPASDCAPLRSLCACFQTRPRTNLLHSDPGITPQSHTQSLSSGRLNWQTHPLSETPPA
ncbi:hypothetical protein MATL_G00262810 [Megalops atlanticus]|uniref:Uncharacterized protein n=1 Tax=Megalops atlanticus TaxID=7932 RepID=A0A9D3SZG4_MEGAT|nr:hypothetical protein MATL_G00262810 [Megalops atlanticus]